MIQIKVNDTPKYNPYAKIPKERHAIGSLSELPEERKKDNMLPPIEGKQFKDHGGNKVGKLSKNSSKQLKSIRKPS